MSAEQSRELHRLVRLSAPTLRRSDVERLAGVDSDRSVRWWRAMGFPVLDPSEPGFGPHDVTLVRRIAALEDSGLITDESVLRLARLLGATFSRVAEAQVGLLDELMANMGPDEDLTSQERLAALVESGDDDVLDLLEASVVYVWRRHLSAALASRLREDTTEVIQAVGFVDLSGFARLSAEIDADELATLVDAFESSAVDVVSAFGSRVVKLIGDEVLFVSGDVSTAVDTALSLSELLASVEGMPPTHSGIAFGSTVSVGGDVFGPTVNLAARLRSVARPGTIAVTREDGAALEERPDLQLKRVRRSYDFKGTGRTRIVAVRRAVETPLASGDLEGLTDYADATALFDVPDKAGADAGEIGERGD